MLKRLFAALRGKQSEREPDAPMAGAETAPPPEEQLVTVYDAEGHELQITLADWRDKVFLPQLESEWDNADALYNLIISGVNDGLAVDLAPAAARLHEIDHMPERSHVTLGIVQMNNGQLDLAEATLRAGMAKVGETGTLLTNLAKVFDARGDAALADQTLWRAVQADPNQENGMMWWATIQRERHGEEAYVEALRTVAALPGSWRAQLWLAQHCLGQEDVDAARALYAEVLAMGTFDRRALMMISGALGNAGQVALIVELVAPAYDERTHDPMTGLNLLRAYQVLGRIDEGRALLARMYALEMPPIRQYLDSFAQAFQPQSAA